MRVTGRTPRFLRSYRALSRRDQELVTAAIRRLEEDPWHPSLRTGKREPKSQGVWYCRASRSLRILFTVAGDEATLLEVGSHDVVGG